MLHTMAVLGYLPKLKRGLGLSFGAYLVHDFSIIFFLFKVLPSSFKKCYPHTQIKACCK